MTKMHQFLLSALIAYSLIVLPQTTLAEDKTPVQNGDIIFQTSLSNQSLAIQKATNSRYSHMGIIVIKNNQTYVFEASKTVRYTPLQTWINRGKDQHFVLKRLKNAKTILNSDALNKFLDEADTFKGKPYDLSFEWSDKRIYCSELVWKIYKRALNIELGSLRTMASFNLTAPEVQAKIKERYGSSPPLNEPVISPKDIYNSPLLITVKKI